LWIDDIERTHNLLHSPHSGSDTRRGSARSEDRSSLVLEDESSSGWWGNVDLTEELGSGIDMDHTLRDRKREALRRAQQRAALHSAQPHIPSIFQLLQDNRDHKFAAGIDSASSAAASSTSTTASASASASSASSASSIASLPVHHLKPGSSVPTPTRGVSILTYPSAAAGAAGSNTKNNASARSTSGGSGSIPASDPDAFLSRARTSTHSFGCPKLSSLTLGGCNISNAALQYLSVGCTDLVQLDLFHCQSLTDVVHPNLTPSFSSLVRVDVMACFLGYSLASGSQRLDRVLQIGGAQFNRYSPLSHQPTELALPEGARLSGVSEH
jgi:hypothetical protein